MTEKLDHDNGPDDSDGADDDGVDERPPPAAGNRRAILTAVLAVGAVVAVLLSGLIGYRMAGSTPGDNSVEAGFARDMQTHHQQAVEMSFIIRDKTSDQAIRTMAYDIITSQQQQMGQMYGWLQVWGLPQTGSQPPMAWMKGGHDGMNMGVVSPTGSAAADGTAGTSGSMPGMATPAQLQQLRDLKGRAADRLFLQLMIKHHQGGLEMAQAVQERSSVRPVTVLADAIRTAQTAEIAQMRTMLAERPATG